MPGVAYIPVHKLVEIVGLPTAIKLTARFPGVRLYVPHPERLNAEHAIVKAIGLEAAKQFCEEWRQLEVMVPGCSHMLARERNRLVRDDKRELSARQCALKYELSERMIFLIWAGADVEAVPATGQPDLF